MINNEEKKNIITKIKERIKKINNLKIFVKLSIILEIEFLILAIVLLIKTVDLQEQINKLKVDVYEIKEEIK